MFKWANFIHFHPFFRSMLVYPMGIFRPNMPRSCPIAAQAPWLDVTSGSQGFPEFPLLDKWNDAFLLICDNLSVKPEWLVRYSFHPVVRVCGDQRMSTANWFLFLLFVDIFYVHFPKWEISKGIHSQLDVRERITEAIRISHTFRDCPMTIWSWYVLIWFPLLLTGAFCREFSGMIHNSYFHNNPSNPQQPIQKPYVKRTSKSWTSNLIGFHGLIPGFSVSMKSSQSSQALADFFAVFSPWTLMNWMNWRRAETTLPLLPSGK